MNMMKRSIALALMLMLLVSMAAGAQAATLKLPAGISEIEEQAFYGSAALDRVVVPDGVKSIGSQAFAGSSLTSINLPRSITSIADDAFANSPDVKATVKAGSYAMTYCAENGIDFEVQSVALPSAGIPVSVSANKTSAAMGTGVVGLTFTRDDGKAFTKDDRVYISIFYLNADGEVLMTDAWRIGDLDETWEMSFQCAGATKVIIEITDQNGFGPGEKHSVEIKLTGSDAYDYCDFSVYGNAYPGGKVLAVVTLRNPEKIEKAEKVTLTTPAGTVVTLGEISKTNTTLSKEIRIPASWKFYDDEGNERDYVLTFNVGDYWHDWYLWIEPMCDTGLAVNAGESSSIDYRKIPSLMPYAFEVENTSIATIDQYGTITGVKAGKTTGTMTTNAGQNYTFEIIVRDEEGSVPSENAPVFYVAAPKAQALHGDEDLEIFRIYSDVEDSLYLDEDIPYTLSFYDENNQLVTSFEEYRYINADSYVKVWSEWQYWDNRVGKPYRYVEFRFGDIEYEVTEPSTARVEVVYPEELGLLGFEASSNYGTYTAGDTVEIEITCTTPELLASYAAAGPVKVVPLCQNGAYDILENVQPAVFNADTKSAIMSFTISDNVIPGEGFYVPFYYGTQQVGYYSVMIHSGLSRLVYNATMTVGESSKLPITIAEGADWNNVYFDVFDPSILTVDSEGVATALKAGETEIEVYYETSYGIVDTVWLSMSVFEKAEGELPVLMVTPLTTSAVYGEPVRVRVQLSDAITTGNDWIYFRLTSSFQNKYGDVIETFSDWKNIRWTKLLGEGVVYELNNWPTSDEGFALKTMVIVPGYTDDQANFTIDYEAVKIPVTGVPERGEVRYGISPNSAEFAVGSWVGFNVWRTGDEEKRTVELKNAAGEVLDTTTFYAGIMEEYLEFRLEEDDYKPLSEQTVSLYVDGEKVENASYTFTIAEPQLEFDGAPNRMSLGSSYEVSTFFDLDGYTCDVTMSSSDPTVADFDEKGWFTANKVGTCMLTASCAHQTITRKVTVFNSEGTVVPELYLYSAESQALRWRNSCDLGVGIIGDLMEIPAHAVEPRINVQILDENKNVLFDAVEGGLGYDTLYCALSSNKMTTYWYDANVWMKMAELDGRYFRFILSDNEYAYCPFTIDEARSSIDYELVPLGEANDVIVGMTYPDELAAGETLQVTFTCYNPAKLGGGRQIAIFSDWDESTALVTGVLTQDAPIATLSYQLPADFDGDSFCVGYQSSGGDYEFDSFWLNLKQ